ncbi:MAG: hypothetical protein Q8K35_05780 [Thiobacillus sp.]|nr:hypothetical protein [Thiobacillus sp.]MDP2057250.1 hypothetical protein [Thiobacillus sp.]
MLIDRLLLLIEHIQGAVEFFQFGTVVGGCSKTQLQQQCKAEVAHDSSSG